MSVLIKAEHKENYRQDSVGMEDGDQRVALNAGFIFMLIPSWFPSIGVIIACLNVN